MTCKIIHAIHRQGSLYWEKNCARGSWQRTQFFWIWTALGWRESLLFFFCKKTRAQSCNQASNNSIQVCSQDKKNSTHCQKQLDCMIDRILPTCALRKKYKHFYVRRVLSHGENFHVREQTNLNSTPTGWNVYFHCSGKVATSKLLFFSFSSLDHWNGKKIRVNLPIKV